MTLTDTRTVFIFDKFVGFNILIVHEGEARYRDKLYTMVHTSTLLALLRVLRFKPAHVETTCMIFELDPRPRTPARPAGNILD